MSRSAASPRGGPRSHILIQSQLTQCTGLRLAPKADAGFKVIIINNNPSRRLRVDISLWRSQPIAGEGAVSDGSSSRHAAFQVRVITLLQRQEGESFSNSGGGPAPSVHSVQFGHVEGHHARQEDQPQTHGRIFVVAGEVESGCGCGCGCCHRDVRGSVGDKSIRDRDLLTAPASASSGVVVGVLVVEEEVGVGQHRAAEEGVAAGKGVA